MDNNQLVTVPSFKPIRNHYRWNKEEDEALVAAVSEFSEKKWKLVAEKVPERTPLQCCHRWKKLQQSGTKGKWSIDEDQKLIEWVKKFGTNRWKDAPNYITGRNQWQCRSRWLNQLNPEISHDKWTPEEEQRIFQCFHTYGAQWTTIASHFPGRTENQVKNCFNACKRSMQYHKTKLEKTAKMLQMTKSITTASDYKPVHPNAQPQNQRRGRAPPILANITEMIQTVVSKLVKMKHEKFDKLEIQNPSEMLISTVDPSWVIKTEDAPVDSKWEIKPPAIKLQPKVEPGPFMVIKPEAEQVVIKREEDSFIEDSSLFKPKEEESFIDDCSLPKPKPIRYLN